MKLQVIRPTVFDGERVYPGSILECSSNAIAARLTSAPRQKFRRVGEDQSLGTVTRASFLSRCKREAKGDIDVYADKIAASVPAPPVEDNSPIPVHDVDPATYFDDDDGPDAKEATVS